MDAKPDARPLGLLALGSALLSLALSVTYFFSPHALVVAVVALLLGGLSRSESVTRGMGTVAIFLALIAIAISGALIVSV